MSIFDLVSLAAYDCIEGRNKIYLYSSLMNGGALDCQMCRYNYSADLLLIRDFHSSSGVKCGYFWLRVSVFEKAAVAGRNCLRMKCRTVIAVLFRLWCWRNDECRKANYVQRDSSFPSFSMSFCIAVHCTSSSSIQHDTFPIFAGSLFAQKIRLRRSAISIVAIDISQRKSLTLNENHARTNVIKSRCLHCFFLRLVIIQFADFIGILT